MHITVWSWWEAKCLQTLCGLVKLDKQCVNTYENFKCTHSTRDQSHFWVAWPETRFAHVHKDTCLKIFIKAYLLITKFRKHPKCSHKENSNKLCYHYIMGLFSSLKWEMDYFELTCRTIPEILFNEKSYVAKCHAHYETKEISR